MPDPFPADHDDHHGGAVGRGPHRARLWRRRRSPAAAGASGGGRIDVLATGDPVPDAGVLYLHGRAARKTGTQEEAKAGTPARTRRNARVTQARADYRNANVISASPAATAMYCLPSS